MTDKDEKLLKTLAKLLDDVKRYGERNATDYYQLRWEQWSADMDNVNDWLRGVAAIIGKLEYRSMMRRAEKIFRIED